MMKWSEKTPNDTPDSSIVGGIKTAQARQCICTLQVQMQTKIEQSPSEMLVEAQRNFLMAMKRLRCVCQTVICLCAIPMPLACIGVATVRRLPPQLRQACHAASVAVRRTRREAPGVDGYFLQK